MLRAAAACHFSTSKLQKVARTPQFFLGFWHENVLRATAASGFFDVWTSTCKWSEHVVFCAFLLRATATCHFSRSELEPDVFWAFWLENALCAAAACHFSFLCWTATSAPAALASLLFEHQEPRIIEKTQRFATFLTFGARVSSF